MNNNKIIPVILSGGMGSRLWPMSRSKYPKQFLELGGAKGSLLQQTAKRVTKESYASAPIIVSNKEQRFLVAEHMQAAGFPDADIILEPVMRNTAAAIAVAALHVIQKYGDDALMIVLPSDHIIADEAAFHDAVEKAAKTANEGYLVTFGINPEYPETGYGYIKEGEAIDAVDGAFKVAEFVEKPPLETAKSYLEAGNYAWNSGMFLYPAKLFLSELEKVYPEIILHAGSALKHALRDKDFIRLDEEHFVKSPNEPVDCAVMEKTDRAAVVPVSCGWSDAGAWDSLWRMNEKNEHDNVETGEIYTLNSEGCYLHAHNGAAIAALGLKDIVVVSTKDAVMVADKHSSQDVKTIMNMVKAQNSSMVENHQRVYRPWGYYEKLLDSESYKVRYIHLNPQAEIMVDAHHTHYKNWVVIDGEAEVAVDGVTEDVVENHHCLIPPGKEHVIKTTGNQGVNFIEIFSA